MLGKTLSDICIANRITESDYLVLRNILGGNSPKSSSTPEGMLVVAMFNGLGPIIKDNGGYYVIAV